MKKVNCKACGSSYIKIKGNFIICESCDSTFEIEVPQAPPQTKKKAPPSVKHVVSKGFYPFSISKEACEEALIDQFITSEYVPDDLALRAKITDIKRAFVPIFYMHAKYRTHDGQKKGSVTACEVVNKAFAEDFAFDIAQAPGWKDFEDFDEDQTLVMSTDDGNTKMDAKLIELVKDALDFDEKFNITTKPNSEVLLTPFYTGTFEYKGESYTFAVEGRGLDVDFQIPPHEKVTPPKPGFFKGIGFCCLLIFSSLIWLYTGGIMPFCSFRDEIAATVMIFSAIALVAIMIIGRVRRSAFSKAADNHKAAIREALNEGGASIDRALVEIESRPKKNARIRMVSHLIAIVALLAVIGGAFVVQMGTIADMLEARQAANEAAAVRQELIDEMEALASGLEAALDNSRIMRTEVYLDRQNRRRVRVYLDSRYLSSNRRIAAQQLGDMLYQMVAHFDEPEEGMPFGRYRIVARIPGSNNNVRAAFWPAPFPGRDYGNQNRFTIRYYTSGSFDSQSNYPFPYEE